MTQDTNQDKIDSLRTAVIISNTEMPVLDALPTSLPKGYSLKELPSPISEDRTHFIRTPTGDEIHLTNSIDATSVETANIIEQDERDTQPPLAQDELSKLAVELNKTGKVCMQVTASNNDLKGL